MPSERRPKARRAIVKARSITRPIRRSSRRAVTRAEYNAIIEVLSQRSEIINELRRELEIQFKRMAQIQSELDDLRRLVVKTKS